MLQLKQSNLRKGSLLEHQLDQLLFDKEEESTHEETDSISFQGLSLEREEKEEVLSKNSLEHLSLSEITQPALSRQRVITDLLFVSSESPSLQIDLEALEFPRKALFQEGTLKPGKNNIRHCLSNSDLQSSLKPDNQDHEILSSNKLSRLQIRRVPFIYHPNKKPDSQPLPADPTRDGWSMLGKRRTSSLTDPFSPSKSKPLPSSSSLPLPVLTCLISFLSSSEREILGRTAKGIRRAMQKITGFEGKKIEETNFRQAQDMFQGEEVPYTEVAIGPLSEGDNLALFFQKHKLKKPLFPAPFLQTLSTLPALSPTYCSLPHCPFLTPSCLSSLSSLPSLKYLSLSHNPSLSDSLLSSLLQSLPLLSSLDVSYCKGLTRESFKGVLSGVGKFKGGFLREVRFSGDEGAVGRGEGFLGVGLGVGMGKWEVLHLKDTRVEDGALGELLRQACSLKRLALDGCDRLSIQGLEKALKQASKGLKMISLTRTEMELFNKEELRELEKNYEHLEFVYEKEE